MWHLGCLSNLQAPEIDEGAVRKASIAMLWF